MSSLVCSSTRKPSRSTRASGSGICSSCLRVIFVRAKLYGELLINVRQLDDIFNRFSMEQGPSPHHQLPTVARCSWLAPDNPEERRHDLRLCFRAYEGGRLEVSQEQRAAICRACGNPGMA